MEFLTLKTYWNDGQKRNITCQEVLRYEKINYLPGESESEFPSIIHPFRGVLFHIDLGAEKIIATEKYGEKIAVEIKSFSGSSVISDQYNQLKLIVYDPDREVIVTWLP